MPEAPKPLLDYFPAAKRWPLPTRIALTIAWLTIALLFLYILWGPVLVIGPVSDAHYGAFRYLLVVHTPAAAPPVLSTYFIHWPQLILTLALSLIDLLLATLLSRHFLRR